MSQKYRYLCSNAGSGSSWKIIFEHKALEKLLKESDLSSTTVQLPSPAAISNTLFCITKASDRSYLAQTVHTSICAHVPNPPLIGSKTADTVSVRRRQRDLERLMFVYTRVRVNGRPTYIVEWSLSARHIDKKKKEQKATLGFLCV